MCCHGCSPLCRVGFCSVLVISLVHTVVLLITKWLASVVAVLDFAGDDCEHVFFFFGSGVVDFAFYEWE